MLWIVGLVLWIAGCIVTLVLDLRMDPEQIKESRSGWLIGLLLWPVVVIHYLWLFVKYAVVKTDRVFSEFLIRLSGIDKS